jgi:hypothetical protein
MDPHSLLLWSAWLLAATGAVGAWMAVWRFGKERPPPRALTRLHGALALAGLAVLVYAWVSTPLPRLAVMAAVLLMLAASGGLSVRRLARWRWAPSIEVLVFGHASLAATGYLLLLAASMSRI